MYRCLEKCLLPGSKMNKKHETHKLPIQTPAQNLPTNFCLTKIKITQHPNCSLCHNHHRNLIHLFWDCEKVAAFRENVTEKLKQCNLVSINYQKNNAIYLGLRPDTSHFSLQLNFNYCGHPYLSL